MNLYFFGEGLLCTTHCNHPFTKIVIPRQAVVSSKLSLVRFQIFKFKGWIRTQLPTFLDFGDACLLSMTTNSKTVDLNHLRYKKNDKRQSNDYVAPDLH